MHNLMNIPPSCMDPTANSLLYATIWAHIDMEAPQIMSGRDCYYHPSHAIPAFSGTYLPFRDLSDPLYEIARGGRPEATFCTVGITFCTVRITFYTVGVSF